MPPAFNLSQDQTLEFNLASFIAAQSSTRASRRKTRFECGRKPTFVGNLNCPRAPSFDLEGRPSQRRRNAHSTRLKFGVKPPRKKNLKIFRKARFFSSEAPAVRPRPRQAESDVFYTAENKKQAPRRKIAEMISGQAVAWPLKRPCGPSEPHGRMGLSRNPIKLGFPWPGARRPNVKLGSRGL